MIIKKKKTIQPKPEEKATNINNSENVEEEKVTEEKTPQQEVELFEPISNISERQERRRGDRRRGYRRIEDRGLVSRAHEEAQIIKEQATKDGLTQGLSQAENEISNLQKAISDLIDVKQNAYEYYKKDIIDIAMEIAKKILAAQVQVNPETIVEIATNVIKEVAEEDNKITFVINPEDELVLSENLNTNPAFNNKKAKMTVQTSEKIEKGSCKVITNSGQIDATFSSQLSIIEKAFKEGM